jgi:hypothetical protein
MPKIIIKGTIIDIPSSGTSANWAPAVIEAFQALADAVNVFTGTFDVSPQAQSIDAFNPGTNIDLDNLVFPPSEVRSATVYYTVYRKTEDSGPPDGLEVSEAGTLEVVYNSSRPNGEKWEVARMGEGEAFINFNMTDLGQIQFSTEAITGINHTGIVSYRAISILNN